MSNVVPQQKPGKSKRDYCNRKVYTGLANSCQACIDAHRAAEKLLGVPIVVCPSLADDVVELRGPDGRPLARATGMGDGGPVDNPKICGSHDHS